MRIDYPRQGRTGVRHWLPSWRQVLSIVVLSVALAFGALAVAVAVTKVPPPSDVASAQTTIVYWSDGKTELGRMGTANRTSIPLSSVPLVTQHAVLSAEDRDFYDEGGVSPKGIVRAVWNDVQGGSLQGGSTITQQYAKNAFLTQDRTFTRKIQEFVLALKLDTTVSKDQILEDYLNTIYFGRGAYGIQSAAEAYYGVPADKLTLGQSAALAAIIRSPGGYNPDTNLLKLKKRYNYVLDGMVQKGWITPEQKATSVFPTFVAKRSFTNWVGPNGYLLDSVRKSLLNHGFTEDDINRGGLRVVSTFDRNAQKAAVQAVKDQAPTSGTKGLRIGLAAVRPGTGEVVAMYGGADYVTSPLNNATQAVGQAGSTFKPFALAAGIEQGISLDSMWNGDSGISIDGYKVNNYGDISWGQISLLQGTERSVNSVYVGLSQQVGYSSVVDAAVRAGVPATTPALSPVRSVALGVASPHVIDMAGSYATFADRGQEVAPTVLKKVTGPNGGVLYEHNPEPKQAFTSDVADTVNYALRKVVTDGTGVAALALGRPAAGKTGTTNENKSAWFAGYTPDLAAAVMFVKDDANGNPVSLSGVGGMNSVTGGSFPARIWTAFMSGALQGSPVQQFVEPSNQPTASPTPSPTTTSASPTPSPTGTSASPSPTGTSASPSPTGTSASPSPTGTSASPSPSGTSASPTRSP